MVVILTPSVLMVVGIPGFFIFVDLWKFLRKVGISKKHVSYPSQDVSGKSRFQRHTKVSTILAHITLFKTNIAPENEPSQLETSIPTIHFQVLC